MEEKDLHQAPLSELAKYINAYHEYFAKVLPILGELTDKIMRVHGPNHAELRDVNHLYHTLKGKLEQRIVNEEALKALSDESVGIVNLDSLEKEFDEYKELLTQLRNKADNYYVPEDACSTFSFTYNKLEEVEAKVLELIDLEQNVIFPRLK